MAQSTINFLALASLFVFAALGGVLSVSTVDQSIQDQQVTSEDTEVQSLFDCQQYQKLFGKRYSSRDESMSRCVYLLATALDVFASGVAYKFRKENYYLAVNELSDWSPKELDMMRNKALGDKIETDQQHEQGDQIEDNVDLAKIVNQLQAEIKRVIDQTNLKQSLVDDRGRKKRETSSGQDEQQLAPRHISMDMLIKNGKHAPKQSEIYQKLVVMQPTTNNGNYDALAIEPITQGLVDQQERVYPWVYSPVETVLSSVRGHLSGLNNLVRPFNPFASQGQSDSSADDGTRSDDQSIKRPNEMLADLRQTGCFFPPRHQGRCGSCYAFASTSIMEYLYCKEKGFLTPFSEQYMVDCGNSLVEGIDGCDGAVYSGVSKFIHNFGLELRHNYRYTAEVKECPYSNDTNLETTGYIRFEKSRFLYVSVKYWPELLDNGTPLYVRYSPQKDFHSYAGGVYDGEGCSFEGHAMVLVGHGREDGQDFWLLRNSHGTNWGEEGYFKLAKSAPTACIKGQYGLAFGTTDGKQFAELKKNDLNKDAIFEKLVLKRYRDSEISEEPLPEPKHR